jgi:anti-sigma regulatory factor (Ser/Thr protein kinase)
MPCDISHVRQASQTVRHFLAEQGCSERDLMACELALVEACASLIRHSTDPAKPQDVVIETLSDDREIELRVSDSTEGFDWPKRAVLPPLDSEAGRGIFLIQSLMDSSEYFRRAGANLLIMRKQRAK